MKRILIFAIFAFVLIGCTDDFLDQPLRGQQELDDFFASEEASERFINGIYQKINGEGWNQINFMRTINEMATDDQWSGNTEQPRADITGIAHYNVFPGSAYINSFWAHNYIGITRANLALDYIPNVEMNEDSKNRLLAEAKFLRAWFYFELVKTYGGVPIVTTWSELFEPEVYKYTRATVAEVYALVEQDLIDAIDMLPLKSQYAPSDMGRVTKGAAQSLLAKAYLFQEKYPEAEIMAQKVITSNEYQLEPNFEDVWKPNHLNGVESIFEVGYIADELYANIGGVYSSTQGSRADLGWSWGTPTSNLENAFLAEGDVIRLRSTIIKHGEPVYGDSEVTSYDAAPDRNKSGRINRKFYVPKADRPEVYKIGQHPLSHIHIRYADLLLMHAEAAYFNNNEDGALTSLKEVRDRVSLTTNMSLSGNALRDAIWNERRLELALELHRLYDLRRQKINGVPRLATIMGPTGTFVNYNVNENTDPFETTNLGESMDKGTLFDVNTHLLWPIPPEEIQLSQGSVEQNPGY